ncbi:hypothetical protein N9137_02130 [Pseudomonadales bacterium]|nr:hypothetical protein [Pseudomonadales bacterium]
MSAHDRITKVRKSGSGKLNLGGCNLNCIPYEVWSLVNTTRLYLYNNLLTSVSPKIEGLTKLRFLSLSTNNLTTLPVEVANLSALNYLDVSNNHRLLLGKEVAKIGKIKLSSYLTINDGTIEWVGRKFTLRELEDYKGQGFDKPTRFFYHKKQALQYVNYRLDYLNNIKHYGE